MTTEQFASVLERMLKDQDYAEQATEGDFGEFDSDELTPAEQALLRAAAGEIFSEVGGFSEWISPMDLKGISGPFQTGYGASLGDVQKVPAPPAPNMSRALEYTGIFKF